MPVYALGDAVPVIDPTAFVHPDPTVIGHVTIGARSSVWPQAVLRADFGRIVVGAQTSIQDGTVIHTTEQWPTMIGDRCVVGHDTHLEGCTVGNDCLIGSGSVVLNRAVVETGAGVGAGALVTEDAVVPAGHIALGVPARPRPAPDLAEMVAYGVGEYLHAVDLYRRTDASTMCRLGRSRSHPHDVNAPVLCRRIVVSRGRRRCGPARRRDGEPVARLWQTGPDVGAAVEHARTVGGSALRALCFPERAALVRAVSSALAAAAKGTSCTRCRPAAARPAGTPRSIDAGIGILAVYASKGRKELTAGRVISTARRSPSDGAAPSPASTCACR